MEVRFATKFALAIALLVIAGCESSGPPRRTFDHVPQLDVAAANAAGLSAQQVSEANEIYTVKCAKCHRFYDPAQYSQTEWDDWMRKMSRKAKLNPAQRDLLARYLNAFRDKPQ